MKSMAELAAQVVTIGPRARLMGAARHRPNCARPGAKRPAKLVGTLAALPDASAGVYLQLPAGEVMRTVTAWGGPLVLSFQTTFGVGRVAAASSEGHAGEYAQGPILSNGRTTTVLASIPDPTRASTATCWTTPGTGTVHIDRRLTKARDAVTRALLLAERHDIDLYVDLSSDLPAGVGAGRSSADCYAACRAACAVLELRLHDTEVAKLCWQAERASDPVPFSHWGGTPIWASREGRLVEVVCAPTPLMTFVAFVADPTNAVSTVDQAAATTYSRDEIRAFTRILARVKRAICRGSAKHLGLAGGESLSLNQVRCPTPKLENLRQIATAAGALGVMGSHSGSMCVIAFDGRSEGLGGRLAEVERAVVTLGCADVHWFSNLGVVR